MNLYCGWVGRLWYSEFMGGEQTFAVESVEGCRPKGIKAVTSIRHQPDKLAAEGAAGSPAGKDACGTVSGGWVRVGKPEAQARAFLYWG